ncbi:glycosyl hydrolase family 18 protein [Paenibacillus flagellatus]|uniref:chitinase n=1 Tax=Paenibacillus flagellatus TaxID=2211139 RepID=A0A2V5KVW5_9BACL|nr:glycosyl hydrolase family 18 protein [Paenibacillus flagellatus]PYI53736.1 hypothetical protein DLM86_14300 [Paenibacillus flagellatus]
MRARAARLNLAWIVLLFVSLGFGSLLAAAAPVTAGASIEIYPIRADGKTVEAAPAVTGVPAAGETVVKAEFFAKASSAPDSAYFPFPARTQPPYTWNWGTGEPYVPDGFYDLKIAFHYASGRTESVVRQVIVDNTPDKTPPPSPVPLTVGSRTSASVELSWAASAAPDANGYVVERNGVHLADTASLRHAVDGLDAGQLYAFRVKAKDLDGNVSIDDNSIGVRLPSDAGTPPDPLPVVGDIRASGAPGVTPGSKGYSGNVTLSVQATDDRKVEKVEFFTKVLHAPESDYWKFPSVTVTGSTYSVNWATPYAPEGDVIIKAVAYDSSGQFVTRTGVFLVDNKADQPSGPDWEPADRPPANRIVGYFAAWSTYGSFDVANDLDASRLTHLNYAFADIGQDLKVKMGDPVQDPKNFEALAKLKAKYPHLKTLVSVGGWTWSGQFSAAAATEQSRTIFAESAVDFMVRHGFDGVDLDWEYPVVGGGPGTTPNPADRDHYPLLLAEVREKLDERGRQDGKRYLLTIAGGATASFAHNAQLGVSQQYLDYVQIMTYDIHGTWETRADFNAPLFDANGETYSVDKGVQAYLDAGVPADKLVMGVPFYGYKYKVSSAANNGLRQPFTATGSGSVTYDSIVGQKLTENGYVRYWHEGSKVPYLFNPAESVFISYDDEQSIGLKADYIRDRELGGAMIWELSQDRGIDLLNVLYEGLKDPIADGKPPVTSHALESAQPANGGGWYGSDVTVKLTARDNRSGPVSTEYRVNGGEWTAYTGPFVLSDGAYTVEYRSTDGAGNREAVRSVTVKTDSGDPELAVTVDPAVLWPPNGKSVPVHAEVLATDPVSGVADVRLVSVTVDDTGTPDDIREADVGTLDTDFLLNATRSGSGSGRIYSITYRATDYAGHSLDRTVTVTVSHDRGH